MSIRLRAPGHIHSGTQRPRNQTTISKAMQSPAGSPAGGGHSDGVHHQNPAVAMGPKDAAWAPAGRRRRAPMSAVTSTRSRRDLRLARAQPVQGAPVHRRDPPHAEPQPQRHQEPLPPPAASSTVAQSHHRHRLPPAAARLGRPMACHAEQHG
jgi:hypothetical protein